MWSATTPATPGRDRRLPRERILRRRSEFLALRREGESESGSHLKLNWRPSASSVRRMAIVVPKTCGNAVVRNRIKRWVREAWRSLQSDLPAGLDSVWIARPKAGQAGLGQIRGEIEKLYRQAKLLPKVSGS